MSAPQQSEWQQPQGHTKGINIYNTLTRTKAPLITKDPNSLTWYVCGPTVYDASHLGHARTYLSFDIIRRILKDYFRYDVTWIMNITDIDDKIIIRSREQGISFTDLARKWEASFMEDMKALNIQPPDSLTRVSEYVPEIVQFVEGIIKNGYAYESNGSVYFDTEAFGKTHQYAKLMPEAVGDAKLLEEGEGALAAGVASGVGVSDKRNKNDFALWKKSKEGEPKWASPWGEGRPGWHIECSAMASHILGSSIDVHSGGQDLRFPHHDNELAQSEAYHNCNQWVNYFVHSGHLHIDERKMSKSLKNFITIRESLSKYSSRQMRMMFLQHRYEAVMDYSEDSMEAAHNVERQFQEFFHAVKALNREKSMTANQYWGTAEKDLHAALVQTRRDVHTKLQDNFDTPSVILALSALVSKTNVYLSTHADPAAAAQVSTVLVHSVAQYITDMFRVFGLIETHEVGFGSVTEGGGEEALTPIIGAFSAFRDEVRTAAKAKEHGKVLSACDSVRDNVLPLLGIRLEDRPSGVAVFKLESKEDLMREMEAKKAAEEKKIAQRLEQQRKEQEELEKGRMPADQLFRAMTDKYSEFDERGMPTKDEKGEPVSKSALGKLAKVYEKQTKMHKKYQDWQQKQGASSSSNTTA